MSKWYKDNVMETTLVKTSGSVQARFWVTRCVVFAFGIISIPELNKEKAER